MANISFIPLEFRKFSGGITDDFVDCEPTQCQKLENLLVDDQEKLYTRPGSVLYNLSNSSNTDTTDPRPSSNRIGLLYNYFDDTDLFAISADNIYYYKVNPTNSWQRVTGPTGNQALPSALSSSQYSVAENNKHLFITSNASDKVSVIYPTSSTYFMRTTGLPLIAETKNYSESTVLAEALALANDLRTQMLAHFVYTTGDYHFFPDNISAGILTAPVATTEETLYTLIASMIQAYKSHTDDVSLSTPKYHLIHPSIYSPFYLDELGIYYMQRVSLRIKTTPTTLEEAVEVLNNLRFQWIEHDEIPDLRPISGVTESWHWGGLGDLFLPSAPAVSTANSGVVITNDISLLIAKADTLRRKILDHTDAAPPSAVTHATITVLAHDYLDPFDTIVTTTLVDLVKLVNFIIAGYSIHLQYGSIHLGGTIPANNYISGSFQSANNNTALPNPWGWVSALLKSDSTLAQVEAKIQDIFSAMENHFTVITSPSIHNGIPGAFTYDTHTIGSYIYELHYFYEYTIGGITYEVRGPVTTKEDTDILIPNQKNIVLTNIPVLTNSIDDNYDTANIKIKIFRTKANGNVSYYVATIDNGTTTYTDNLSDADLTLGDAPATIYTTGGVLEAFPPPVCKFIHNINGTLYFGNISDGDNRLAQSTPTSPESAPTTFFLDLPEEITGISSFKGIPIVFTPLSVYRIEGKFDLLGRGGMSAISISDHGGCIAPYTPVQTIEGVYFFGKDGVYVTDGYSVKSVSTQWRSSYIALTTTDAQKAKPFSAYDAREGRVWFSTVTTGSENDGFYVMDMGWGVLGDKAFSTVNGGSNFAPTSACFFRDEMIRGDSRGYIFKHNINFASDPKIDPSTAPSSWTNKTIIWDYISRSIDWGASDKRKWSGKLYVKARNVGNVSIQARSIDDLGQRTKDFVPIRYRSNCLWGDTTVVWGTSTLTWGFSGFIDEKRLPPQNSLRFSNKQIQLTNAYTVIQNSDTLGNGTLTGTSFVIASNWNNDLVDNYIYFSLDSYAVGYLITGVSAGTLTLSTAPTGGTYSWIIKGYPKNERLSLLSIQTSAGAMGDSMSDAQNELGSNA